MNGVPGTISALPSGYTGKITSVSSLANWVNGYTN